MSTAYSLTDSLPKDAGGAKFGVWVDDSSSSNDYALPRGIAKDPVGATSRILAHLAIGTHITGSAAGSAGVVLMGIYTESPSAIALGGAQQIRSTQDGDIHTMGGSVVPMVDATSKNTYSLGSAVLYGYHVVFNDVNAGDKVIIQRGASDVYPIVATAASQHFTQMFSQGQYMSTSIIHTRSIGGAGATSVTLMVLDNRV